MIKSYKNKILFFACILPITSLSSNEVESLYEETHETSISERQYLTGDWYGARTEMENRGIAFHSNYVINAATNLGGRSNGATQASSFEADLTFDFEKLFGWSGWELFASGAFRFGRSLSALFIGNAFSVQQVFGGQTYRLVDLYLSYRIPEKFFMKFGRINTGEDFQVSPLFSEFMSNSFNGNPIIPNFNFLFSTFPVSTWGFYTEAYLFPSLLLKAGIYNNQTEIFENNTHGVFFHFNPSKGVLLYSEGRILIDHSDTMSGKYILGAAYSIGKTGKILQEESRANHQLYVQWEETFLFPQRNHEIALSPFFTFLYFPEDRNEYPYFFMGGVVLGGIIPSRPDDRMSFGGSYGAFSSNLPTNQTFESCLEANYKAQITDYFYIEPNIQYVIRPNGLSSNRDALVFGVQSSCIF